MTLSAGQKAEVFDRLNAMKGATIGVSVSGGGDSMALTALACEWAKAQNRRVAAVTVDHGLRAESGSEAERVGTFCAEMGISHDTLLWNGWDGGGNLQDQARQARFRLIGRWAKDMSISHVATGHNHDDQAETVLLRLARGSGVDGLAGMEARREHAGLFWHRPLLTISRSELRDYLAAEGLPWIDDPSNEDTTFDRVKARQALEVLKDLGIDRQGLVETASRMRRASHALKRASDDLGREAIQTDRGDVLMDWQKVEVAPDEIRNRLVASALMWVSCSTYRPALRHLKDALMR